MPAPYALDTTGALLANRVVNESYSVATINNRPYRVIVPAYAPFFTNNLVLEYIPDGGSAVPMVENVDYDLVSLAIAITRSLAITAYGCIVLTNTSYEETGIIRLSQYQTIGGIWTGDQTLVLNTLATLAYNPRMVSWDQISNIQQIFPPDLHSQPVDDFTGMAELLAVLEDMTAAIADQTNMLSHVTSETPHIMSTASDPEVTAAISAYQANQAVTNTKTVSLKQLFHILQTLG